MHTDTHTFTHRQTHTPPLSHIAASKPESMFLNRRHTHTHKEERKKEKKEFRFADLIMSQLMT